MKTEKILLFTLLLSLSPLCQATGLPAVSSSVSTAETQSVITHSVKSAAQLPDGMIKLDGRVAPPLVLKDIDGNLYDINNLKGDWVFVHFWATWCGPCRAEIPTIQDVVNKFENTKLNFLIINTAETEDTVFSFLGVIAPDIIPLMDHDGLVTEQWQPRGLPATYFVDPEGRLQYLALGGRPWNEAEYLAFLNLFSK